jgi:hypothetical protein
MILRSSHVAYRAAASRAPQASQKRASARFSLPQVGQTMLAKRKPRSPGCLAAVGRRARERVQRLLRVHLEP